MKKCYIVGILIAVLLLSIGCSSYNPSTSPVEADLTETVDMSRVIGSGKVEFDLVNQEINLIPDRDSQYRWNISWLLTSSCPGGCFQWRVIEIDNAVWTIELTIENPTAIQVWDVRILLIDVLGTTVVNPDGYSDFYTPGEWVPFINFTKDDPERAFPVGPEATDSEIMILDFKDSPGGTIHYIIEAAIDEPSIEPVQIDPPTLEGIFFSNYKPGGRIIAYVHDHQMDATVTINATNLGLGSEVPMYDDGNHGDGEESDGVFGSELLIPTVESGIYTVYIEAYDNPEEYKIRRPVEIKVYPIPDMISIPEGTFQMGNGPSDPYNDDNRVADEKPFHTHATDAYDIGKYEITVGEYAAFVEHGGYFSPEYWSEIGWLVREDFGLFEPMYWNDDNFCGPDKLRHPIIGLSWYEAEAFCNWISDLTGDTWRLPTEAEWERAARGDDDDRPYPWGNSWDNNKCNTTRDNITEWGTSEVGTYSPQGDSPWGCADMLGNANEWTADWYNGEIYSQYAQGDFTPPASGTQKVARGAVWWTGTRLYIRNSFRWNMSPVSFNYGNGFRILREVD